ncbi:uncharacterized protein LY89DRAFT_679118 [Mollisia scopiformis]|uniref:Uncharacterized protein n=1 Tax=Mollisia scopiformis TaxID=149040 RepID=A0A194XU07_MOLSC|nr:uncharacterized protein LY89DRAFT_679118 [Mollisia scopiformis]KUJ23805.1 hypothetical protein LY89DRAFT_679118 [Mollisia scopiformis]
MHFPNTQTLPDTQQNTMFITSFVLLVAAVTVFAQLPANYTGEYSYSGTNQSADFNLVIQSRNTTLNGALLGACHDGAAYEGLCIVSPDSSINRTDNYVRYQWNTTYYICDSYVNGVKNGSCPGFSSGNPDPYLNTGIVTWWLPFYGVNDTQGRVSEAMNIEMNLNSNVALTQIDFESGTQVAFDKQGLMNILEYYDDTKEPGSEYLLNANGSSAPKPQYRWHVCETLWTGYHYTTLTWVLGIHSPQNPTCQDVNVKRVFL